MTTMVREVYVALKRADVDDDTAAAAATAVAPASDVATVEALHALRGELARLRGEIAALRREVAELRTALSAERKDTAGARSDRRAGGARCAVPASTRFRRGTMCGSRGPVRGRPQRRDR
jgi:septal ring factor EnvC (AmiA/AmiB activator)